jgi:capsular exopolysaccharide synthesis family protein
VDDVLPTDLPGSTPTRGGPPSIFQVLWQRRGLVLLGLVVGTTLGLLSYFQRPPVYRASAQVLVVKKQEANALAGPAGVATFAVMDDYVATHLIVIRSPTIITRAVQKRNLGALRSLQGGNPVAAIQHGLTATRDANKDGPAATGNNVINLTFQASDPADAETVLTAVIESYKDFLDETYKNTSDKTFDVINQAIDRLRNELAKKNREYKAFRHAPEAPLLVKSETGETIHKSRIIELQKKETTLLERHSEIEWRLQVVKQARDKKLPREVVLPLAQRQFDGKAPPSAANEAALKAALLPLKKQEAELAQFYGEDYPGLSRIRAEIEMTKKFYQELDELSREADRGAGIDPVASAIRTLEGELALVQGTLTGLRDLIDKENTQAKAMEKYEAQDREFRNEIGGLEKTLDATLKRLTEVDLVRGHGGFDARAITPPAPLGKVSPVFWQFLLLGGGFGLILGAASAYLLDLIDKSFRTPEEIRLRLGLPIVGHVPFAATTAEPVEAVDGGGNPVELDPGLLAFHNPGSPEAEAFRGIRTALYFSTHGPRHKVIQVTSPNMGDGKTTLITNLAVSISQSGRRVLIIDADLRRPRTHRVFGMTAKVGLAEVIAGTAELDEAVQVTAVPNLSILPCGRRPPNPAELLTSPRFEDVLDDVRSAFDYVLVDSPPLLAVSDPCIVAPRVDGLLLTIRLSKNGRPAAERARALLTGLKVNCVGVVVNGVGRHGAMNGYGYDHYWYADEYTTAYTSADPDTEPEPAAAPEDHPPPALNGTGGPSANGHTPHVGE